MGFVPVFLFLGLGGRRFFLLTNAGFLFVARQIGKTHDEAKAESDE
jgi:hypothetical protein